MPRENDVKIRVEFELKGQQALNQTKKALADLSKRSSKTGQDASKALKSITPAMEEVWQQTERLAEHWKTSFQQALPFAKKLGKGFRFAAEDTLQLAKAADTVANKYDVSFKRAYSALRKFGVGSKHTKAEVDKLADEAVKFANKWGISFQAAIQHQARLSSEVRKKSNDIKKSLNVVHSDVDKTAKVARKFSQRWGVSFKSAYNHVKKLSVAVKKDTRIVSHDVDKVSKVARTFAKNWGVSFDQAYKHVSKMGVGMTKTAKIVERDTKKMGTNLTFLAWHFRYLGSIFDRIGRQIVRSIKNVTMVSAELEESFLSIRTAAVMYGQDAERATAFSKELALTGLMPLIEAASSVKNLMITGIGLPELEKFAYRYLDVAFLMTSGMDEMQKSLEVISKSMLRGTLVLSADVTARMLWTETEKRLQKTLGVSMKELSARRKMMEILKTIEEKYAATLGFHQMEMETTRATMNRLNTAIALIKDSLGKALVPLVEAAAQSMAKLATYITIVIDTMGPMVPILMAVGVAVAFFVSKISWSIGILLSFAKIAGAASLALWKIYLPIIAVSAIVVGATYLWLKYSGALDKVKTSAAAIDSQLQQLKDTYQGLTDIGEDSIEADEDRALAHRRRVEDLEEDLERERSKGLWANQMTIKDLEKRLKRENEDWGRYMKGRGEASDTGNKGLLGGLTGLFGDVEDVTKAHSDKIKSLWNALGVGSFKEFQEGITDPLVWREMRNIVLGKLKDIGKAILEWWEDTIGDPLWRKIFVDEMARHILLVGDTIQAMFEGLFGSVGNAMAIITGTTFAAIFIKQFAVKMAAIGVAASSIGAGFGAKVGFAASAALTAALPATITVGIFLLTGAALTQAIRFRSEVQDIWDGVANLQRSTNELFDLHNQQLKEGIINAEEFKDTMDDVYRVEKQVISTAEEASEPLMKQFLKKIKVHDPIVAVEASVVTGIGKTFDFLKGIFKQYGGIVPGPIGKPMPIIAHGGERIVPSRDPSGGAITVNINNPSVRSEGDIQAIANQVKEILGQRNRFARLGAY